MRLSSDIYVRVYKNKLTLRVTGEDRETGSTAHTPFTSERLLVGDFPVAENLLRDALKQVLGFSLIRPRVLIQPMEMLEGGLSQVEMRIFRELAMGAGARAVAVWVGVELSDPQISKILDEKKVRS